VIEKRREEREEADESAFMELLNPVATERLPVNILNRSKRGMCVGSTVFLPRGAEVRVFVGNIQFFGSIRYCVAAPQGFRAGLEIAGRIQHPEHQEFNTPTAD